MSKWMQVVAMALAAVVGLVPAFAQLSYAQAVPSSPVVLPVGDELEDTTLAGVDGEAWPAVVPLLVKAAKWLGTALIAAERVASSGCQKAVQVAGQAAAKMGELTMRGVTLAGAQATQHPVVRDTVLGMTMGVTGEAARATLENRPLTLRDVGFGLAWGGVSGAGAHWIARGLEELGRRGP